MTKKNQTRLFALLLREQYEKCFTYPQDTSLAAIDVRTFVYLAFLKEHADPRHSNAYSQALSLIQGAA